MGGGRKHPGTASGQGAAGGKDAVWDCEAKTLLRLLGYKGHGAIGVLFFLLTLMGTGETCRWTCH